MMKDPRVYLAHILEWANRREIAEETDNLEA
jgi:hypothetical protein